MRRISALAVALIASILFTLDLRAVQQPPASSGATCDPALINPDSYRLTTEAQALNALRPREPWWEPYGIWKEPREIGDPNEGATTLAERARELDEKNLLAHGQLARQYVVMAVDARKADDAWQRVLDSGGAVVWPATLYDVDPRSVFVFAFDRTSIRIFRLGQLAGALDTHFGVPEFPGPETVEFWRALGGCLPPNVAPEAEIAWGEIAEIGGHSWALRFELSRKVSVTSDRGNRRNDDRLEVALHGQPGFVDFRFAMTRFGPRPLFVRPVGPDPVLYQERLRHMLTKSFDPAGRIRLPKLGRSFTW